jgi:hypothetical protein
MKPKSEQIYELILQELQALKVGDASDVLVTLKSGCTFKGPISADPEVSDQFLILDVYGEPDKKGMSEKYGFTFINVDDIETLQFDKRVK